MAKRRTFSVALIGTKFMGRVHSNAWRQAPHFFDLPANLRLAVICGRDKDGTQRAAKKLGWEESVTDWRRVIEDPEIDVVDICTPNDSHAEIAIAAARAGKAILCEKPLARNLSEAKKIAAAVQSRRVPNMLCHNYRRVPAIALAKQLIERGDLGDSIYHFRARYAQDWIADPNFPMVWRLRKKFAGSGALGDIGTHLIDLARYLVGEIKTVSAVAETFIKRRPRAEEDANRPLREAMKHRVDVDDSVCVIGKFRNGALLNIEATRFAYGRQNQLAFEINGNAGSLAFDLERMNELQFYRADDQEDVRGFRRILVSEPTHPYMEAWWPPGHIIGYEHSFIHTIADFVDAIIKRKPAQPDFADGLKTQRVLDAIERSAKTKRHEI